MKFCRKSSHYSGRRQSRMCNVENCMRNTCLSLFSQLDSVKPATLKLIEQTPIMAWQWGETSELGPFVFFAMYKLSNFMIRKLFPPFDAEIFFLFFTHFIGHKLTLQSGIRWVKVFRDCVSDPLVLTLVTRRSRVQSQACLILSQTSIRATSEKWFTHKFRTINL